MKSQNKCECLLRNLTAITLFIFFANVCFSQTEIKITWFNLRNYIFEKNQDKKGKSQESKQELESEILQINPDILFVCEIGGFESLYELQKKLEIKGLNFPFLSLVKSKDKITNIALLSKIKPLKISHLENAFYKNKEQAHPVLRGFAHCVFQSENKYKFHLFAAHLKSNYSRNKEENTSQRLSEARILRRFYHSILSIEKDNFLVLGDMNDSQDSKTLQILMNRDKKNTKYLFDIRPSDKTNTPWTIYWKLKDQFSRFDYALASESILAEIDFSKTKIPSFKNWNLASDHRPLIIVIKPEEKKFDEKYLNLFNRFGSRIIPQSQKSSH